MSIFRKQPFLSGDTLVEVMFAVGIFGIVAISAISAMNRGLQNAQGNLEITMARQEIDAQSESIRFIHDAYITEKSIESDKYTKLWEEILKRVYTYDELVNEVPNFYTGYGDNDYSCFDFYDNLPDKAFVINPRALGADDVKNIVEHIGGASFSDVIVTRDSFATAAIKLRESATHPRLIFANDESEANDLKLSYVTSNRTNYNKNLYSAEGIWVTVVRSEKGVGCGSDNSSDTCVPDYYDFYIRTCWNSPDGNRVTTINSTIRLYNPD